MAERAPELENTTELLFNALIAFMGELPMGIRVRAVNRLNECFCEHCGADGDQGCIHKMDGWDNAE